MGTYIKGIHGGTSGKVGNVIGANWRSIDYWRSLSRKSNKPATQEQIDVRYIFDMVSKFLKPAAGLIKVGYPQEKNKTAMNAALSYHITEAVTGVSPNFTIDYKKAKFCKGPLLAAQGTVASAVASGSVGATWLASGGILGDYKSTDKAVILIYNPAQGAYVMQGDGAVRDDLEVTVTVPASFVGDLVHVWMYFIEATGKYPRLSNSVHVGMVTVI